MTQPSRTTESISRDNAAIRAIMHDIRDLTVPDRATLAVGLIGHLATMMNRAQMAKLMDQLREEAERVQDVPPARQREQEEQPEPGAAEATERTPRREGGRSDARPDRSHEREDRPRPRTARGSEARRADSETRGADSETRGAEGAEAAARARVEEGVGQAGRGEFRSGRLV